MEACVNVGKFPYGNIVVAVTPLTKSIYYTVYWHVCVLSVCKFDGVHIHVCACYMYTCVRDVRMYVGVMSVCMYALCPKECVRNVRTYVCVLSSP